MSLDPITHKNILIKILKDIFTDPVAGPILGFKGGSAAYLFYGLNRFSVDLDFDLLEEKNASQVFTRIREILASYGTVKKADRKRFSLFYLLSYEDKVKGAHNIKVEINVRGFGSIYEVKSYLGISMKVMVREDMVAHKLVAMVERIGRTNRDIYDAWFFLNKGWPVNTNIVEERTGMKWREFLQKCISLLVKMPNRGILSGMGELLDAKQKAWVKLKLREETLFALRLLLENARIGEKSTSPP